MRSRVLMLAIIISVCACTRPARSGELIERYKQATCVPWRLHPDIRPDTRCWDYDMRTRQGASDAVMSSPAPNDNSREATRLSFAG